MTGRRWASFAIAGMCFGIILGWVIGTEQASKRNAAAVQLQPAAPPQATNQPASGTPQPPALDEAKVPRERFAALKPGQVVEIQP